MRKAKMKTVEITRKLTLEEKICPVCGKQFWGAIVKRYCSRACQNKANYERRADAYRESRMKNYRQSKEQVGKK